MRESGLEPRLRLGPIALQEALQQGSLLVVGAVLEPRLRLGPIALQEALQQGSLLVVGAVLEPR